MDGGESGEGYTYVGASLMIKKVFKASLIEIRKYMYLATIWAIYYPNLTPFRYQGREGYAPAAYLQRYHGAVITNEVTTGAQVVTSLKDAISTTDLSSRSKPAKPVAESATWKPVESSHVSSKPAESASGKPTESNHVSSKPAESATWKLAESALVTSLKLPDPKPKPFEPPKTKSWEPAGSTSPTSPKSVESVTSPKTPSPKPDTQKFAPTWHSMKQPYIDKERKCSLTHRYIHIYTVQVYTIQVYF